MEIMSTTTENEPEKMSLLEIASTRMIYSRPALRRKCHYFRCPTNNYDNDTWEKSGITLYNIPLSRKREFLERMNVADLMDKIPSYKSMKICSLHFPISAFMIHYRSQGVARNKLVANALPFDWKMNLSEEEIEEVENRTQFRKGDDIFNYMEHHRPNTSTNNTNNEHSYSLPPSIERQPNCPSQGIALDGTQSSQHDAEIVDLSSEQEDGSPSKHSFCRLCGDQAENMVNIFSGEGVPFQLAQKINSTFPIIVSMNDKLPLQICCRCLEMVFAAHRLFTTVLEADKKLKALFHVKDQSSNNLRGGQQSVAEPDYDNDQCMDADDIDMTNVSDVESELDAEEEVVLMEDAEADDKTFQLALEQTENIPFQAHYSPFICSICEITLADTEEYLAHSVEKHKKKLFHCHWCKVFFSNPSHIKLHKREVHGAELRKIESEKARARRAMLKQRMKCNFCAKEFSNKAEYTAHLAAEKKKRRQIRMSQRPLVFDCNCCEAKFPTKMSRDEHKEKVHGDDFPFHCPDCPKTFRKKDTLVNHGQMSHSTGPSVLCNVCGKILPTSGRLRTHMLMHRERVPCPICHKLQARSSIKQHIVLHKRDEEGPAFQCDKCNGKYASKTSLTQHMQTHSDLRFVCYFCNFTTKRKVLMYEHIKNSYSVPDDDGFKCNVNDCGEVFPLVVEFYKHICNDHNGGGVIENYVETAVDSFFCRYCSQLFSTPVSYMSHTRKGHREVTEPILTCSVCMMEYDDIEDLKDHIETHPECLQYECQKCPMKFALSHKRSFHELTEHFRVPKRCPICNKLVNAQRFEQHVAAHGKKTKSWTCDVCDKMFTTAQCLKLHRVKHLEPQIEYKCQYCSEVFFARNKLGWHEKLHTARRTFNCEYCNYACVNRQTFKKHQGKCPGGQEQPTVTKEVMEVIVEDHTSEETVITQPYSVLFYM